MKEYNEERATKMIVRFAIVVWSLTGILLFLQVAI